MKKLLSLLIAGVILVSTSFTAFAAENPTGKKVMEQMEGAVSYLTNGKTAYTVDDVLDYYTLVSTGADMSKYNDAFLQNMKENLDKNSGRIVSTYGESLATYGAAILILDSLDLNPSDFYGYDITKTFTSMDPQGIQASPYYYRVIIPAAVIAGNDEFAKSVCDFFVNTYYVMGKGMDNWGFSCDNTGYFITALAPYGDDYPEIMKDAFAVLESYKTDGGYFCDTKYLTSANTDSTALALMAYSSYSIFENNNDYYEKLNSIYADLCTFEGSKTGVFISAYTEEDNDYATKEALMALEKYYPLALEQEKSDNQQETVTTPVTTDEKEETTTTDKTTETTVNESKKSPATGVSVTALSFALALGAGALSTTFAKRKEK